MLLKGAYCVGEHFVDPQCTITIDYSMMSRRKNVCDESCTGDLEPTSPSGPNFMTQTDIC